jgi:hypothetical protein
MRSQFLRSVHAGSIAIALLGGCGQSPDSALLEVGRCYKAGIHLQDEVLRQAASAEVERQLRDRRDLKGTHGAAIANYFAPIAEKLNEEMYPQGRTTPIGHSLKVVRGWQQWSYCQRLIESSLRVK